MHSVVYYIYGIVSKIIHQFVLSFIHNFLAAAVRDNIIALYPSTLVVYLIDNAWINCYIKIKIV